MHQLVTQSRISGHNQRYPISHLSLASGSLQVDFLALERKDMFRTVETLRHRLDCIENDLARLEHSSRTAL